VNFTRVQLVEQRHRHESCEHHRVVDIGLRDIVVVVGVVEVEQTVPFISSFIVIIIITIIIIVIIYLQENNSELSPAAYDTEVPLAPSTRTLRHTAPPITISAF